MHPDPQRRSWLPGGVQPLCCAAMSDDPQTRRRSPCFPGRQKRAEGGHPWIYSNEIAMDAATKALPPGGLVTVRKPDGKGLGVATFNAHPLVSARLLSRDATQQIDRHFSHRGRCAAPSLCASSCSPSRLIASSMPRLTGCPASSSTALARRWSVSSTPPAWRCSRPTCWRHWTSCSGPRSSSCATTARRASPKVWPAKFGSPRGRSTAPSSSSRTAPASAPTFSAGRRPGGSSTSAPIAAS